MSSLVAPRLLAFAAVLSLVACGGSSAPPPPAASPTPAQDESALRPLTSREGGPAAMVPGDAGTTGEALPPGHPPIGDASRDPSSGTPSGPSVSGTITVSAELAARVSASDVLYVMAKKDGATVAVQRLGSPSFPLPFQVSEGHAMVAGTALEGPVDIVARLSKTGDAIPSAGDLEGTTSSVAVPAEGVSVTMDHVRQ